MTTLLEALNRRVEELACHDRSCAPPPVGTGGSRKGSRNPTDDGVGYASIEEINPDNNLSRAQDMAQGEWNISTDQSWNSAVQYLKEGFNSGNLSVRIRIPPTLVNQILVRDQRVKTQHETGTSGGKFDPDDRDANESQMFGVDSPRPVYGYVGRDGGDNGSLWYGSVSLVLKPEVADRATITVGDSYDWDQAIAPVKISDVKSGSVDPRRLRMTSGAWGGDWGTHVTQPSDVGGSWSHFGYVEAQIFGGVTKDDIHKVVVTQNDVDFERVDPKVLRDAGYDVEIISPSNMSEFSLVAAYRKRMEELACHDASCAPPPVGTGGSKPGPSKGKLSPTESGRVAPKKAFGSLHEAREKYGGYDGVEQKMREAFSGSLGGGFESAVIKVNQFDDVDEGVITIRGDIVHPEHGKIGYFNREIKIQNLGVGVEGPVNILVANHDHFSLDAPFQGQGIAQRFNDRAMKLYEELGVDRITTYAALSHGPFAWARQGYRFDESAERKTRHEWVEDQTYALRERVKRIAEENGLSDSDVAEMSATITQMRNASAKGADVQPIHVASLGQGDPRWSSPDGSSWLGKDILISHNQYGNPDSIHNWAGVYYLGKPVEVASAYQRRMEELACHDASCAPPPVGTGGSKSKGSGAALSFSKPSTFEAKREATRAASNAMVEAQEAHKRKAEASDAYYKGQATNEALEAKHRAEDEHKLKRWQSERAQFDALVARTVEAEVVAKVGRKKIPIKVYKDDTEMWDDEKVSAAVNQYVKLIEEFDIPPVPIAFGTIAATRAIMEDPVVARDWSDGHQSVASMRFTMDGYNNASGFVTGDLGGSNAVWVLGVTGDTAGVQSEPWNPRAFNSHVADLDGPGRAEYVVTHEFGHMLYFNSLRRGDGDEKALLYESGMATEWGLGRDTEGLRLPSLGTYAYSSAREFAAESFAVDHYHWDDHSGVPLEMMLGWAHEQRRS